MKTERNKKQHLTVLIRRPSAVDNVTIYGGVTAFVASMLNIVESNTSAPIYQYYRRKLRKDEPFFDNASGCYLHRRRIGIDNRKVIVCVKPAFKCEVNLMDIELLRTVSEVKDKTSAAAYRRFYRLQSKDGLEDRLDALYRIEDGIAAGRRAVKRMLRKR